MCGFSGIYHLNGLPVDKALLSKTAGVLHHRGPDDSGCYVDGAVGLASTRLSILDLSPHGHMPMTDEESGVTIVHNGEVYNYVELREQIGGAFHTGTDTEVILRAYLKWGKDCVRRLNGIFSLLIWDPRAQRLFGARDHIGVKPFFYAQEEGRVLFGSEVKALLAAGWRAEPNYDILYDFLAHGAYDHTAESFFKGVCQLPPAHTISVDQNGTKVERYWDLTTEHETVSAFDAQDEKGFLRAQDEFLDLAEDAVRLQLRSDVPIAVHVSGGLDSTLLLGLINRINGGQGKFSAFSYNYGHENYDETDQVKHLVKALGWDVSFVQLHPEDVPGLADEAMYYQEQPYPGIITLAKHKLIKETKAFGAKVILEGQGGDEIGAGYQYVFGAYVEDLVRSGYPDRAVEEIKGFARLNGLDLEQALSKTLGGLAAGYRTGWSADGSRSVRADCLNPDFVREHRKDTPSFERPFDSELLNFQYKDLFHTKLPRILRACDRASMAYSRELRVPILDHRLIEMAFHIGSSYKIRGGVQRAFYREAVKKFFPTDLADVPKRAVVDPQRDWLRGELKEWVMDTLNDKAFRDRGIFNPASIESAYEDFQKAGPNANSFPVWQWLSIDSWFNTFIEQSRI